MNHPHVRLQPWTVSSSAPRYRTSAARKPEPQPEPRYTVDEPRWSLEALNRRRKRDVPWPKVSMIAMPGRCPSCGEEGGLFWCPGDSYILCKTGLCDHSERTHYVEFSRDSDCETCVRVILALRSGRYGETCDLARIRARMCATRDGVRVESAFLVEFGTSDGKATLMRIDTTVIKDLRKAGLVAHEWDRADRWL